jgi:hypothetical protein
MAVELQFKEFHRQTSFDSAKNHLEGYYIENAELVMCPRAGYLGNVPVA